ncbi:MAG: hypothetical protein AMS24_01165 [Chlamydiae bacterium SM23_39]|nr:MAG: hypothetical protein AMS24_01165 [Chlamydiae bacterium SM23_39]
MKIIFFGTPFFAKEILSFLLEKNVNILAVVTQQGKKGETEVKKVAEKYSLKIYQPKNISSDEFINEIKSYNADLFLVVAYGKIFKKKLLDVPSLDCINVHASLLPLYRGAAPIQRVLLNGEKKTGVTIIKMVEELDTGDIILQKKILIEEGMDFGLLEKALLDIAKPMLLEVLEMYKNKNVKKITQDNSKATYAPSIKKNEFFINWNDDALNIYNKIKAFSPKPGARTIVEINKKKFILKILNAQVLEGISDIPSKILQFEKDSFIVACKKDGLKIISLQLEGKKKMEAESFIRGMKKKIVLK